VADKPAAAPAKIPLSEMLEYCMDERVTARNRVNRFAHLNPDTPMEANPWRHDLDVWTGITTVFEGLAADEDASRQFVGRQLKRVHG
jgi:hypothetical protein